MKIRCNIQGLDCPHCAMKLESLLKKIEGVADASLNYAMSSLILEVSDDADEDEMVQKAQMTADGMEDGIVIELKD